MDDGIGGLWAARHPPSACSAHQVKKGTFSTSRRLFNWACSHHKSMPDWNRFLHGWANYRLISLPSRLNGCSNRRRHRYRQTSTDCQTTLPITALPSAAISIKQITVETPLMHLHLRRRHVVSANVWYLPEMWNLRLQPKTGMRAVYIWPDVALNEYNQD